MRKTGTAGARVGFYGAVSLENTARRRDVDVADSRWRRPVRLRREEEEDPADRWGQVAAREEREMAAASLGLLHVAGPEHELGHTRE